jgi:hypothetical protein
MLKRRCIRAKIAWRNTISRSRETHSGCEKGGVSSRPVAKRFGLRCSSRVGVRYGVALDVDRVLVSESIEL